MPVSNKPNTVYLMDKLALDQWKLGNVEKVNNQRLLSKTHLNSGLLALDDIVVDQTLEPQTLTTITEEQASIC